MAAQDHDLPFRTYKKMISIMIEALENVTKYTDPLLCNGEKDSEFCPSCMITRNTSKIELITKNPVRNEEVGPLKERIDNVNKQNSEELKELYRATITNGEFTSKGGAGLGFIEMAKTAGNKLDYDFVNLSKGYSLYTFRVHFNM
jgi:hypothetical protein